MRMDSDLHFTDCPLWNEVYYATDETLEMGLPYKGTYYQTFGGGPEGGWLVVGTDVYDVSRNWFEKWSVKKMAGVLHVVEMDEVGGLWRCKYVPFAVEPKDISSQ